MDSTTVFLMRQAAIANKRVIDSVARHNDSIAQAAKDATRATAEWVLLRHDIVMLGMVTIPSIAVVVMFFLYMRKAQ